MTVKRVLVVGGGIGGLSAAIGLRRNGVEVDLVERNKAWTVYHVGIIIQANVVRALKELGVADDAVKAGFPYSGFEMQDPRGHTLVRVNGPRLAGEEYPSDLGMARPALHDVLTRATRAAGAQVRLGVTFTSLQDDGERVRVAFTDGTVADYDLVIGADGLFSQVRSTIFPEAPKPEFTGQGVWRYNLPRPADVDHAVMMDGVPGGKAGYVPLTDKTMYVLYVGAEPGNPWFEPDKLADEFRKRLAPYGGRMPEFAAQIADPSMVVYRPLETILMPPPWYRGRVLLIGDAAHGTTPHLGQGAAQAIEDAVVISNLVGQGGDIEDMLETFMARRYERTRFIWEGSVQIGKWEMKPEPGADAAGLMKKMLDVVAEPI